MGKETIENNILIKNFMEVDNFEYDKWGANQLTEGLYHSSWDWLMPVVKKCFDISEEEHDDWEKQYENIDDSFYQVEITQIYEAVVEFIKWYNHGK